MGSTTFVTLAASRWVEVTDPDGSSHFSNFFFGAPRSSEPGPQAFRAHLGAKRETRAAHFHHVQQFQLFFGTRGAYFQRHEMGPLLLHYADPDTLYGPFGSGDEPIMLMTLRAKGSGFRGVMPDDKALLAPGKVRRHHEVSLAEWTAEPLSGIDAAPQLTPLVPPAEDGLAIFALEAAAGGTLETPPPHDSGGQYYVVVQGSLHHHGTELPEMTVGWGDSDAETPVLIAGDAGVRLLVLRFGRQANEEATAVSSAAASA